MIKEHKDYLETIFNNKKLRNKLEKLLQKSMQDVETIFATPLTREVIEKKRGRVKSKLKKELIVLSEKHNIDLKALKMYVTLDSDIFPKINQSSVNDNIIEEAIFKNIKTRKGIVIDVYKLKGIGYGMIYISNSMDLIHFFEQNIHLFPDSTQRTMKKLSKERQYKSELEVITNEFESKVYYRSLEENFNNEKLKIQYVYFGWISDQEQRTKTLYYFYKNINEKYKSLKNEKLDSFKNDLLERFSKMIISSKNHKKAFVRERQEIILPIMKKDRDFAVSIMNKIPQQEVKEYYSELIEYHNIKLAYDNVCQQ